MAALLEIRPLSRTDARRTFSCGQPDLDRYFRYYAGQNQFKLHLSITYVATTKGQIMGFATVASSSIERQSLPDDRLRRRLPDYPLPTLRLARLAVEQRAQGMGVGSALLRYVLHLALDQRDRTGCVGVVTDAKADAIAFYERYGFFSLEGVREGVLHGDPKPMFLDMGTIEKAVSTKK